MDIINSCFPSYTFSSHNVSKISKWQVLWYSIYLIFSHPISNPSSSHWLHLQSLFTTITTGSAWIITTASPLASPSRLASLQALLYAAVRRSLSKCETSHVTPWYRTQRENGNPADLCFYCLSDLISHPSPSTPLPHNSLNKPSSCLPLCMKGSAGPRPEIRLELWISH